jgi:hypothetical protein
MVKEVNSKDGKVTLVDPNHSDTSFEITLDQVENYRVTFQIGDLSRRL